MAKKIIYSKQIEKGRFYHIHEGSPTGHPGMVFWKNDKRNLYLFLQQILQAESIGQNYLIKQVNTLRTLMFIIVHH